MLMDLGDRDNSLRAVSHVKGSHSSHTSRMVSNRDSPPRSIRLIWSSI